MNYVPAMSSANEGEAEPIKINGRATNAFARND